MVFTFVFLCAPPSPSHLVFLYLLPRSKDGTLHSFFLWISLLKQALCYNLSVKLGRSGVSVEAVGDSEDHRLLHATLGV